MPIQFMCANCYTGRLTFSNIILHKRSIRWTLVASQAEMRKDECVRETVAYEWNLIVMNCWREILQFIQEFGPQIRPSSPILGRNSKSFQDFHPWNPVRRLGVIGSLNSRFTRICSIFKSWYLRTKGNDLFISLVIRLSDVIPHCSTVFTNDFGQFNSYFLFRLQNLI